MAIPGIPDQLDPNGGILVPEVSPIPPCIVSTKWNLIPSVSSREFYYYILINIGGTGINMNYKGVIN